MKQLNTALTACLISIIGAVFLLTLTMGVAFADDPETGIADIPPAELPAAEDNEPPPFDEGVRCKRTRKTGSNRIIRVCTTRSQREEAKSASNEFLREQQLRQETFMIETAREGGVSPN